LPPNSVCTFSDIENKFHDYFFTGETELKLSHLVSVKQKSNESVTEYIRRFRDTRNRCYSLTISDRDLADLAFSGLLDIHKEKLDGQEFLDVSRLLQKALANENQLKESKNSKKLMKSLIVLFVMHLIIRTMRVKMYMLLHLHGHLMINQILVLLSSRLIRVGKMR
jgi:hypothetical protein